MGVTNEQIMALLEEQVLAGMRNLTERLDESDALVQDIKKQVQQLRERTPKDVAEKAEAIAMQKVHRKAKQTVDERHKAFWKNAGPKITIKPQTSLNFVHMGQHIETIPNEVGVYVNGHLWVQVPELLAREVMQRDEGKQESDKRKKSLEIKGDRFPHVSDVARAIGGSDMHGTAREIISMEG